MMPRGGEGIDREHPEHRWRVNDDEVVLREDRLELPLQDELARHHLLHLEFSGREVDVGGGELEAVAGLHDDRGDLRRRFREDIVDALTQVGGVHADTERAPGLWVEGDEEHAC